jgi:2-dehydro-3-deoxyphosphogluconate aldolase/(4S)-4-hydroxy-2-oxoglutarate aldolase
VVVLHELAAAVPVADALAAGGLPVAEVTFRTEVAADAIGRIAAETDVLVGAGTVVRAEQVDEAVEAGARFIVTPGLSLPVIERCRELDVLVIPGVATATEVIAALDQGLDLLKLFPAEAAGGVALLRALNGPFPDVRFVPTGGISAANAASYLELPSVAAVGGSWMVAPDLLAARDYAAITQLAREAVELAAPVPR